MPQFKHIVTVGTSAIGHYQKMHGKKPSHSTELAELLNENPRQFSAELNALIPFIHRAECHTVHLVGSNTPDGTLREAIGQWLQANHIHHTAATFDNPVGDDADPYADLFNLILKAAQPKDGQSVMINATGGFKAQAITAALAGRLRNLPTYYLFETMTQPVFLPTLNPTPQMLEQLRQLDKRTSLTDHGQLSEPQLLELERAGLLILSRRAEGAISTVRLSAYAKLL